MARKPSLRLPKKKKVPTSRLTPTDNASTVAHLIDTIDHNTRHSFVHAKEAAQHAEKLTAHLKKFPSLSRLQKEVSTKPVGKTVRKIK